MKINIFLIFQSEVKKNLEWFQNAFNAQSSFTTGALMETKEANRKGYYDIGYINETCLLYTSPSPRDKRQSRMPSSA